MANHLLISSQQYFYIYFYVFMRLHANILLHFTSYNRPLILLKRFVYIIYLYILPVWKQSTSKYMWVRGPLDKKITLSMSPLWFIVLMGMAQHPVFKVWGSSVKCQVIEGKQIPRRFSKFSQLIKHYNKPPEFEKDNSCHSLPSLCMNVYYTYK